VTESENVAAVPPQGFGVGEKHRTQIGRGGRPNRAQCHTALLGDVGETRGDIRPPAKITASIPARIAAWAGAGIVAAIENAVNFGGRHCRVGRLDHRAKPARPGIDTGIGWAQEQERRPVSAAAVRTGDCVRERMDDKTPAAHFP